MFSAFRPAVEAVLTTSDVRRATDFARFVRDELADVPTAPHAQPPDKQQLHALYDLRSRYLDWELGTGYLGFFADNPGTRYTFTRRLEAMYQMLPALTADSTVLEIGCGAGLFCFDLAQRAGRVVGIDISAVVLDFARRVQAHLRCQNVVLQPGDAEQLPFPDREFDLIVCSEVLEHLLDPANALREMRRVVKDTGTVIVTTPCAASLSDLTMRLLRLVSSRIEAEKNVQFDKKTYLAMRRDSTDDPKAATFMRVHERFDYAALLGMVRRAGFEVAAECGAVFAFPPHYQVFYRACPAWLLPAIRGLERALNRLRVLPRFGAVTTCFRLTPYHREEARYHETEVSTHLPAQAGARMNMTVCETSVSRYIYMRETNESK
jgi:ubiquinone/menaquinone biosynthesis C-methylase UbiE